MAFLRKTKTAAAAPAANTEVITEPAVATRKPRARKAKPQAEQPQAEEQTALVIDITPEPAETTTELVAEPQPAVTSLALSTLPALDAPAVNTNEPLVSYKTDFSDRSQWFASRDGGKSKAATGSDALMGCPVDLALQISKASWGDGFDQRLRLAFMEADGTLAELNLNAINRAQDGTLYVTSPVRALVGALLAISEAEDDITSFVDGARFRLRPGRGRGLFIEVDVASNGQWITMGSPIATTQVAKDPAGLHAQLTLIKRRFRAAGTLLSAAAVIGEIADYDSDLRLADAADQEV